MGVFDQNYKRLGLLIFCFIFLTAMYTCEAVLLVEATPVQDTTFDPADSFAVNINVSEIETRDISADQGNDLFGLLGFITFTSPAVPDWQKVFFAPVVTITLIVLIYLIIDITYDIIKALPFT